MPKKTFTDALSSVMQGADPEQVADALIADTATSAEEDGGQSSTEPKPAKIGVVIAELVMDASLSYDMIVNMIHAQFDSAHTSVRSVASVAARLRKTGVDVPMRRKGKADEATA